MSLLSFNFKNEAIWIVIFSLAIPLIGVFVALIVRLMR
jgi:hypothetical protein